MTAIFETESGLTVGWLTRTRKKRIVNPEKFQAIVLDKRNLARVENP